MEAKDYLSKHWGPRQVWKHLEWPKHRRRLELCAQLCVGKTAVDVGCAYGHSTAIMAEFRPWVEWTGIEFDDEAIRLARQFFPKGDWIRSGGVADLPLAVLVRPFSRPWDSAVCSEVIEHVEDPAALAAGLRSIVTHRAVLTTPASRVNDPGHLRVYTTETLAAVLGPHFSRVTVSIDGPFLVAVADV